MKSDSARVGLKPFLQSGMEGKSQPSDCADTAIPKDHWKAGTGHPGMAQRAHRDYSDPSCQPGENALSSKEWFGVMILRPPARGAGICHRKQLGSFHFAFCHCSTTVQHRVCTRHFLLLPECLFFLALGKAGADFIPKTSWLWESGVMNMMESMERQGAKTTVCPDYAVLEQSHKWETPTPALRNVRLASASNPTKN